MNKVDLLKSLLNKLFEILNDINNKIKISTTLKMKQNNNKNNWIKNIIELYRKDFGDLNNPGKDFAKESTDKIPQRAILGHVTILEKSLTIVVFGKWWLEPCGNGITRPDDVDGGGIWVKSTEGDIVHKIPSKKFQFR